MEESSTLARPYALAAFDQASEEGTVDRWSEMLEFLTAVVGERTVASLIRDPRTDDAELVALLLDIGEGRLSPSGQNFVRVLAANERLPLLPSIRDEFERRRMRAAGRSRVELVSAFELDPRHRQMITAAMARRLGTQVDLSVTVDETLIGGVVIRVGDVVIDASLRGRLKQLALAFD